jgi:AhpD family alkylhydroperoxidase
MDALALTPDTYAAMLALDGAAGTDLDPALANLVRIRASQLNGCAFCVDLHTRQAQAAGESKQRLAELAGWRGAGCFDERERAALDLAEALTGPLDGDRVRSAYRRATDRCDQREALQLLWTIAVINAWNRIAVATGLTPTH